MKNELNREEKLISVVVKLLLILIVSSMIVFATASCEPAPCEDCYTYTYSDGSTEWMCIEYDCDYDY